MSVSERFRDDFALPSNSLHLIVASADKPEPDSPQYTTCTASGLARRLLEPGSSPVCKRSFRVDPGAHDDAGAEHRKQVQLEAYENFFYTTCTIEIRGIYNITAMLRYCGNVISFKKGQFHQTPNCTQWAV